MQFFGKFVGKGPSTWDMATRYFPNLVADKSNGNIAANSYEFYPDDIKALKEIQVSCLIIFNFFYKYFGKMRNYFNISCSNYINFIYFPSKKIHDIKIACFEISFTIAH